MLEYLGVSSWVIVPVAAIPVLGYLYYRHMTEHYGMFEQMGVPGPKPSILRMGNADMFFSTSIKTFYEDLLKDYGGINGSFSGRLPMLNVYDPDILKQILVKNFDSFQNHFTLKFKDYGLRRTLTQLKGDEWRNVRVQMTPAFSSRRLRQMVSHINRCGSIMVGHLEDKANGEDAIDVRTHVQAFMMDTIAGCGFGIDIDSMKDTENDFVKNANLGANNMNMKGIPIYIFTAFPFLFSILQKFGMNILTLSGIKFFSKIVDQVISSRKGNSDLSKSDDILQLLVNAEHEDHQNSAMDANDNAEEFMKGEKTKRKGLTHEDIVGAGLVFFLAGNDTSTSTVTFLTYYLALNQDIQDKVIAEIDDVMAGHEHPNYDLVSKMKYLEMCIEETLRMCPPLLRSDRVCNTTTTVSGMTIPKDLLVTIPIYSIHHNPEIYPEPEKFIPERFSPEEKESRSPYSWLPFGAGPRMCIGQRLAMMEMKMMMVKLLMNYRLLSCSKTPASLEMVEFSLFFKTKETIYIAMKTR